MPKAGSFRTSQSTRRTSTRTSIESLLRDPGFTLIELLTVIAIIGLLVAILVPSATSARSAAKRVKTKVQFSQWAAAMEQFRQEYGYYPAIDGGRGGRVVPDCFAGALTGLSLDGLAAATGSQLMGNVRQLRFYELGEGELNTSRTALCDAFGNTDIAVIYDRNGDGMLSSADGVAIGVRALDADAEFLPAGSDLDLSGGVRAGVIFYSAGYGTTPGDLIFSWK